MRRLAWAWGVLVAAASARREGGREEVRSWVSATLARNGLLGRRPRAVGAVYVALEEASEGRVFRSARSLAQSNPEIERMVASDSAGAARARRFGCFDAVVETGRGRAPKSIGRGALEARTLLLGLRLYERLVFLDTATVIRGSLGRAVAALDEADVAVVGGDGRDGRDGPPLAAVRNTTASRSVLATAAKKDGRLRWSDERLRVATLPASAYDCRDDDGACVATRASLVSAAPAAPWPNALPNFFLRRDDDSEPIDGDAGYRRAPAVFLHVPKAGGNSAKTLLVKDILAKHRRRAFSAAGSTRGHQRMVRSLHVDTRREWDERLSTEAKAAATVLYGAFAFGACASHPRGPCAYYAIFRDPVRRMVSEFKYCRSTVSFGDQCCGGRVGVAAMRASRVDIVSWAREKGNFLLEHLLGLAPWDWRPLEEDERLGKTKHRRRTANETRPVYGAVPLPARGWHDRDPETRRTPIETRRLREGPANEADLALALRNVDKWFAVVGLLEHYEASLALISYVLTGVPIPAARARSVHTHDQRTSREKPLDPAVRADLEAALALDLRLYAELNALFAKQLDAFKRRGLDFT